MKPFIAVLGLVVFCGTHVSAECDGMSHQKVHECWIKSKLFNPEMAPVSEQKMRMDCESETHNIIQCMNTHVHECVHNKKETKMMNMMLDVDKIRRAFDYICLNISVLERNPECLNTVMQSSTEQCEQRRLFNLVHHLIEMTDIKQRLDQFCGFFHVIRQCFARSLTGKCEAIGQLVDAFLLALRYPYCKMSDKERRRHVEEYTNTPDESYSRREHGNDERGRQLDKHEYKHEITAPAKEYPDVSNDWSVAVPYKNKMSHSKEYDREYTYTTQQGHYSGTNNGSQLKYSLVVVLGICFYVIVTVVSCVSLYQMCH